MKKNFAQSCFLVSALLLMAGCSKSKPGTSAALAPEQVPAAMHQAFAQCAGTNQQLAASYVSDYQNQDMTVAFEDLQKLVKRNDLTSQQRSAAVRAMVTTVKQLHPAADGGHQAA